MIEISKYFARKIDTLREKNVIKRTGLLKFITFAAISMVSIALYAGSAEADSSVQSGGTKPLDQSAQMQQSQSAPPVVRQAEKPLTNKDFGENELSRSAFVKMLRNVMPLSPTQITTLHRLFDKTQRAVAKYPGTPPKPTSSSVIVNMSPGETPPVIRLRAGYITSLVFLDATGQPWPIVGYDLGDPKSFNLQPNTPDGKSNTLLVQTTSQYRAGNLAVMLKGQSTPVMLTLMPGQRAVDYRVDLRVPGLGPNAEVTLNGISSTENPKLLAFLDGVPPSGAKQLDVDGAPAQAWLYFGHVFLRTRVTVLSPGWISSVSSADGTHVYEIDKTPVVLASKRGEMVQLSIKGL